MFLTKEEEERHIRVMYEAIYEEPRIFKKKIGELLHISAGKAGAKLERATELGYFSLPQIRKRSYKNLEEFVYFLRCKNPSEYFCELVDKEKIIYHALTGGCTNMWVVAKEELNFSCENAISGPRSDYYVSFAPNHSWESAIQRMRNMVEEFNPKDYEPQGLIKTHWNETIEWDSEYEALFKEFNYDLRKPISPIMRSNLISWGKVKKWMENLSTYCTIITNYFPGGIKSYDPYLLMIETDYEDFIVKLFSELPTTTWSFKVSNRLFLLVHVRADYMRVLTAQTHIKKLHIPNLVIDLLKKGVIFSENHGTVECYWNSGDASED